MTALRNDLKALVSVPGVSGCEDAALSAAEERLRPYVDTVMADKAGNLIGYLPANAKPDGRDAPLVCWCAHIDEVGLIVTGHADGFLAFKTIGNVDARVLPNAQVDVLTEPGRSGVITCLPPHVLGEGDSNRAFTLDELLIDVGLSSDNAATIPVGTRVCFRRGLTELNGLASAAPALDNRACFAAMLEALRRLDDNRSYDLMVCATVGEESGAIGAASLDTKDCAACIVLDVTYAHMPGLPQDNTVSRRAVAIGVGPNITRRLSDMAIKTAVRHGIPFSHEVMPAHTGTDAWALQVSKNGVPTLLLSLPILSMHTPAETVWREDLDHLAGLLARVTEYIATDAVR
jgi:endoglucanase